MTISESRRRANNKWSAENMTILACKVYKSYATEVKAEAVRRGTTVNAVLTAALADFMGEARKETIVIDIPKDCGFTLQQIEEAARACGLSVNDWVLEAIREKL